MTRAMVGDAQGADAAAVRQRERSAGVEPDAEREGGRVLGEPRVLDGIRDLHHIRAEDGVRAERLIALGLRDVDPDAGLEPLTVAVDEGDQRDRDAEALARPARELVE